jgi:hypothetical protein
VVAEAQEQPGTKQHTDSELWDLLAMSAAENARLSARVARAQIELAKLRGQLERGEGLIPAGMQYRANGPHVHDVDEGHVGNFFGPDGWVEGYWPEGRRIYAGDWERIEERPDAGEGGDDSG